MILNADSVSWSILAALPSEPRRGRVHSVYRRTVNILCGDSLWVSLHPRGVPHNAYSISVDCVALGGSLARRRDRFLDAYAGEIAQVSRSWIDIGDRNLRVSLHNARIWDGSLEPLRHFSRWNAGVAANLLGALAGQAGKESPIKSPFLAGVLARRDGRSDSTPTAAAGAVNSILLIRVARILDDLALAWRTQDADLLASVVGNTIGLGLGVTPSGDDFLTGLLAASYIFSDRDSSPRNSPDDREFTCTLSAVIGPLTHSTTAPSYFMLKAALEGLYPEPLGGILSSLGRGDAARARDWVGKMLGLGATSGQDMLAGVLFWFEASGICERCHEESVH